MTNNVENKKTKDMLDKDKNTLSSAMKRRLAETNKNNFSNNYIAK